jgi:uncharacterized membrane protein YhaH (DUF805 family)
MQWFVKALSSYATFSGRARRSEYWYFTLFALLASLALGVVDGFAGTDEGMGGQGLLSGLATLALLLPSLAVTVRRLHDTDRSGWWILIYLVPLVGLVVMLVFLCTDSQPGANRFGPNPKEPGSPWAPPPAA